MTGPRYSASVVGVRLTRPELPIHEVGGHHSLMDVARPSQPGLVPCFEVAARAIGARARRGEYIRLELACSCLPTSSPAFTKIVFSSDTMSTQLTSAMSSLAPTTGPYRTSQEFVSREVLEDDNTMYSSLGAIIRAHKEHFQPAIKLEAFENSYVEATGKSLIFSS